MFLPERHPTHVPSLRDTPHLPKQGTQQGLQGDCFSCVLLGSKLCLSLQGPKGT